MKKHAIIGLTLLLLLSALPFYVTASSQARIPVIIMFKQKRDLALVGGIGGRVKTVYRLLPAVAADIPERAWDALERNPAIEFVVRDLPIEFVGQSTPWGVERIGAPARAVHELSDLVHVYAETLAHEGYLVGEGYVYISVGVFGYFGDLCGYAVSGDQLRFYYVSV